MVHTAERRQLTVLFCDLVGSTELAQRLDPEALRELMRSYQRTSAEVVARYEGHVAQFLGDGLVAYFGFPKAHEDDAERSVRAGLDIVTAVNQITGVERLHVRIGIATGPVVVGPTDQDDAFLPATAVGRAPNIAARLQALADADEVLVADSTRLLLGAIFNLKDLGNRALKGIVDPAKVWRIVGLGHTTSRFEARQAGSQTPPTPFVGRDSELAQLMARWDTACAGTGGAIILHGEPGIGKSRLAQVLREQAEAMRHPVQLLQCSPYHVDSAFYPIIEQLKSELGLDAREGPNRTLDKLQDQIVRSTDELSMAAPLFADLLSLPTDRYPKRMLSAQKHRELTIEAILDRLERLAARHPLLIICEDLQWADHSTVDTLSLLTARIHRMPILLVMTCRPEFEAAWAAQSDVTWLDLQRLAKSHGVSMATQVAGGKALPADLLDVILARSDGVPLFIEELTRFMLEGGKVREGTAQWVLVRQISGDSIPATLHDSLMERLDRLANAKEVAQVAACIGREFAKDLLAALAPVDADDLSTLLDRLVESGLVLGPVVPGAPYSFKHALVQDAAYASLLRARRQEIHERIARLLCSRRFQAIGIDRPELLALHLTRADLVDEAIPQWRKAARAAMAKNHHQEALAHVDVGLALVGSAAEGSRADLEVGLLVAGTACHWALQGYACKEAAPLLARAEALLAGVTDQRLLILALAGIQLYAYAGADTLKAVAVAERLLSLGAATLDRYSRSSAFSAVAPVLWQQGEYGRCRRLLEHVIEHPDARETVPHGRIGDTQVNARVWLSWVHLWTGNLDQARRLARQAIDYATSVAQPFTLSEALAMAARVFAEAGDCEAALSFSRQCLELCDSQHLPYWRGWALVHEGIARIVLREFRTGVERLQEAIVHLGAGGVAADLGRVHAWLALGMANLGCFEEAQRAIEVGRAHCIATGQSLALADLAYAQGTLALLDTHDGVDVAQHWLIRAFDDARANGMRLLELRAAVALAHTWTKQGRRQQAHEFLTPVVEGFTEGFDCIDLQDARAILAA